MIALYVMLTVILYRQGIISWKNSHVAIHVQAITVFFSENTGLSAINTDCSIFLGLKGTILYSKLRTYRSNTANVKYET